MLVLKVVRNFYESYIQSIQIKYIREVQNPKVDKYYLMLYNENQGLYYEVKRI